MPVSFRLQWRCQNRSGPGRRAATGTGAAAKRRQSGCRLVACDDDPGGTARASVALDMSKRPIGVGHHGYLLDLAAAHERDGNRSLCGELCAGDLDEVAVLDDRDGGLWRPRCGRYEHVHAVRATLRQVVLVAVPADAVAKAVVDQAPAAVAPAPVVLCAGRHVIEADPVRTAAVGVVRLIVETALVGAGEEEALAAGAPQPVLLHALRGRLVEPDAVGPAVAQLMRVPVKADAVTETLVNEALANPAPPPVLLECHAVPLLDVR